MIRQANRKDVKELSILRVEHQLPLYTNNPIARKLYRDIGFFENKNAMKAKL